jgi:DNA-binding NarL/FixJ family response regulator
VAALAAVLLRDARYRLIQEIHGTADVRTAILAAQPDVIVVDTGRRSWTPQGEGQARVLLLLDPEADADVFDDAVRMQADGYVSRGASGEALKNAIDSVREVGRILDPQLMPGIVSALGRSSTAPAAGPGLSRREHDILVRIVSGRSTKEVAREYAIAAKTVGNHISNICQKLNLKHRGELVLYALQEGLAGVEAGSERR